MNAKNWIELSELLEHLYLSQRTFYKLKKVGVFIPGEHFYRIGEGMEKGKFIYGLEECRKALLKNSADNYKKVKGVRYGKKLIKEFSSRGL
tara:strand:+ start:111 stop:383 length:273 start_codon:yes stop_codon:yes gene_type:complete